MQIVTSTVRDIDGRRGDVCGRLNLPVQASPPLLSSTGRSRSSAMQCGSAIGSHVSVSVQTGVSDRVVIDLVKALKHAVVLAGQVDLVRQECGGSKTFKQDVSTVLRKRSPSTLP